MQYKDFLFPFGEHHSFQTFCDKGKNKRLIKQLHGTIDQHTEEYQSALLKRGIKLPKVAFEKNTPNFVVDLLSLPDQTLKNYGFIPTEKTAKPGGFVIVPAGYNH